MQNSDPFPAIGASLGALIFSPRWGRPMYKKVLLAYDGSVEGRRALREGAKLAQLCRSEVFLLAVVEVSSIMTPEAGLTIPIELQTEDYKAILNEGTERLKALGFNADRAARGRRCRAENCRSCRRNRRASRRRRPSPAGDAGAVVRLDRQLSGQAPALQRAGGPDRDQRCRVRAAEAGGNGSLGIVRRLT